MTQVIEAADANSVSGVSSELLRVERLKKYYPITGGIFSRVQGWVKSLDDVSFSLRKGETLGVVGESGCGKSTLGRTILRLTQATEGHVLFKGQNIMEVGGENLRSLRKQMQMVFQDPYSSLNPRMKIRMILEEPLKLYLQGSEQDRVARIEQLLHHVGLNESTLDRYPHELSGGQRQRIGIARALSVEPEFIVCDEAVSALDVSIQSQIINLLDELRAEFGLTYMFIAHDLSVVKHISDRIAVMYLGEMVELTDKKRLFERPLHPYTEALLSAVPVANPHLQRKRKRIVLKGDVPNPSNPPSGCRFHTRCPYKTDLCVKEKPVFQNVKKNASEPDHFVACHFANTLNLNGIGEELC